MPKKKYFKTKPIPGTIQFYGRKRIPYIMFGVKISPPEAIAKAQGYEEF